MTLSGTHCIVYADLLRMVSVYQLCTVLLVAMFHADDVVTLILFFYCIDVTLYNSNSNFSIFILPSFYFYYNSNSNFSIFLLPQYYFIFYITQIQIFQFFYFSILLFFYFLFSPYLFIIIFYNNSIYSYIFLYTRVYSCTPIRIIARFLGPHCNLFVSYCSLSVIWEVGALDV